MDLSGRVALITGGGRGIGRAIALALAEDGADIGFSFRRDVEAARETEAAIRSLGRRALGVQGSVQEPADCDALVEAVASELGPIDILVNNAGVASRGHTVARTDPSELENVVRVHALGPHRLCQRVLPEMKKKDRGDIIMISSTATLANAGGGAPYNMAKAAMEALALTLSKEVRKHGIRVNIVAPGLVDTEMGRRLVRATQGIEDIRKLDAVMPFGRVCQPEDVAGVVRFLVSDRGSYLTGEKIAVHAGGM